VRASLILLCGITSLLASHACTAQVRFRHASVDSAGQLRLLLSDGKGIQPSRDSGQVGFDDTAIAPDGHTAGWLALYPNCCTSYAIPLELVLLGTDGHRVVIRSDLPIWQWEFDASGRRIVLREAPVHGDGPMHYEQRDSRTARLLAAHDAQNSSPTGLPEWARALVLPGATVHRPPNER
jgi:hypothetical protein